MAVTTSAGYSNRATSDTRAIVTYNLGVTNNYALRRDEPTEVVLVNTTTPVDVEEILTYRCKDMSRINTALNIQYPSPVSAGIQYQVAIETTFSTVNSDTGARVDEPIVAQLTVRHPKSGNITDTQVAEVVSRLLSAAMKDNGDWRFNDLMRSALKPTEN